MSTEVKGNTPKDADARARQIHADLIAERTLSEGQPPAEATAAEVARTTPASEDTLLMRAEAEQWKHKFQVLQGKYNAEVPRLHEELKTVRGELGLLKSERDAGDKQTLDTALATVRSELGDSVAEALQKLIPGHSAAPAAAPAAEPELDPEQSAEADAQMAFDHVKGMVDFASKPGTFDQVNLDPAFTTYLAQTLHPQTQQSLQLYMNAKFAAGDLQDVARVFLQYVQLRTSQAAEAANKARGKAAAPDVTAGATNNDMGAAKTYSRAEYESTMKSLNVDAKYRTQDGMALANRIRNELLTALRDGRVL